MHSSDPKTWRPIQTHTQAAEKYIGMSVCSKNSFLHDIYHALSRASASSRPAQPHLASHCLECLYCDHDKCAVVVCCAHRHIYLGPVYITSSCSSFALVLVVCFSFALVLWVLEGPAESDMFMLCALALPTPVADRTGAFWRRKQFRTSRSVSGRYARVGRVSHRFEHCADTFKHGVSDHTIFR